MSGGGTELSGATARVEELITLRELLIRLTSPDDLRDAEAQIYRVRPASHLLTVDGTIFCSLEYGCFGGHLQRRSLARRGLEWGTREALIPQPSFLAASLQTSPLGSKLPYADLLAIASLVASANDDGVLATTDRRVAWMRQPVTLVCHEGRSFLGVTDGDPGMVSETVRQMRRLSGV